MGCDEYGSGWPGYDWSRLLLVGHHGTVCVGQELHKPRWLYQFVVGCKQQQPGVSESGSHSGVWPILVKVCNTYVDSRATVLCEDGAAYPCASQQALYFCG